MSPPKAKHWCFTINNPTEDHEQALGDASESDAVTYLVFGREVGENGTPHFQGFVSLTERKRTPFLRTLFRCTHIHTEVAKGKPAQAAEYCKKDGDFEEFGELPTGQGKRTDIDDFVDYIKTTNPIPNYQDIATRFPHLWLKYRERLMELLYIMRPPAGLVQENESPYQGWQSDLYDTLTGDPDDRTINFFVDEQGNSGKTWFTRYFMTHHADKSQVLRIGKRDDLALAIDPSKSIFFFDVPRGQMEYLQYSILESIKDRIVFSPKFHSTTKIIRQKCHVVVFSNERPDESNLSNDRLNVITI